MRRIDDDNRAGRRGERREPIDRLFEKRSAGGAAAAPELFRHAASDISEAPPSACGENDCPELGCHRFPPRVVSAAAAHAA
jgi:hypothetical protein